MAKGMRSIRREVAPALLKSRVQLQRTYCGPPCLETIQEESPRPRNGSMTAFSSPPARDRRVMLILPVFISLAVFFFCHRDVVLVGRL